MKILCCLILLFLLPCGMILYGLWSLYKKEKLLAEIERRVKDSKTPADDAAVLKFIREMRKLGER